MSHSFWQPSDDQRRAILLLEVVGLLHDVGKLSNGFIKKTAQDKPDGFSYDYQLIVDPNAVLPPVIKADSERLNTMQRQAMNPGRGAPFKDRTDLTNSLQAHRLQDWDNQSYSLAELLLAQFAPRDWARITGKSAQPAELIRKLHGIAHYEKEEPEEMGNQLHSSMYASSPFGVETLIPVDVPDADLTSVLKNLPLTTIHETPGSGRLSWLTDVKKCLARGIADTRRPTNEVSLWDWGFTVATLTKAAAAYIFKNGWPRDLNDLPYRTLRISLDILERYTRSDKITDLIGVRQSLTEGFSHVQSLLEETYALGNCFYHDETGSYYLLPDIFGDDELAGLRQAIQAHFSPDLRPLVHLGKRITAGQLDAHDTDALSHLVAKPRAQALSESAIQTDNNLYLFEAEWTSGRPGNAEICMACGVRPVGYPRQHSQAEVERKLEGWATQEKAARRNICRVCLDRRGRRAKQWAKDGLQGTIWTDEVADDNGRLALFVGKLDLEGWLDGELLSTLQVTSNTTKNPSPARLYRIAETARQFWDKATTILMPPIVGQRPFRLALYPQAASPLDLGDFHAYELEVGGMALNVVWDKPNRRFLTAEDLTYFARRLEIDQNEIISRVSGCALQVLEPSAFLNSSQPLVKITIERVEKLVGYLPAIPLLAEPSACLMLVPANRALEVALAIKHEYERQMGRVRDRLPLCMGLVFCHRRTPVRAVLEAGRAMLKMNSGEEWEEWQLMEKSASATAECKLTFDNGVTWQVPVVAGDSATKDEWYPRMYEGDSWAQRQVKHVSDLQVPNTGIPPNRGWKVWVRPSGFDFEFLDATGRRFEIYYDANGRRPRRTRPFYLEDMDRLNELWKLMKDLAVTQRHQIIRTIEATREEWYGTEQSDLTKDDGVFQQFVADTLAGADWPKGRPWDGIPREWRDKLIQAGTNGELTDLAELHMEILKER